jgi:starch synthase
MLKAIRNAIKTYPDKKIWRALQKEGMKKDFSWAQSARKYQELYERALTK